jgi:hypothetical protein
VTTTVVERPIARSASRARDRRSAVALGAAVVLLVVVHVWGRWLQARGYRLFVNLPPLVGHLDPRLAAQGLLAPAIAVAAVAWGPGLARSLRWRHLLWAGFAGAAAWAVSLALTEGVGGLLRSPASPRDYLADTPLIGSPLAFLRTYVEEIDRYTTHVRAHPPGMALIAWTVARAGGGPGWMAGLEVVVAASAVPAVLLGVRELAGEARARAAAPFLAFAPAAISIASSGDALFTGVGAWAVALVVLASGRRDRRGDALALGGGLLFGVTAFLSYGLVLLAAIPLVLCGARRRARPIALATLGASPVFLGFLAAGFWWGSGLLATRIEYAESVARLRPYGYFLVANVATFAVISGPAAVAGLAWVRERGLALLVGGALAAVLLANVSGMSKAEVERIWLPFAVWTIAAAGALPAGGRRAWLAASVAFGLGLEIALRQPW